MNWVERYLDVIPAQAGSQATTGGSSRLVGLTARPGRSAPPGFWGGAMARGFLPAQE